MSGPGAVPALDTLMRKPLQARVRDRRVTDFAAFRLGARFLTARAGAFRERRRPAVLVLAVPDLVVRVFTVSAVMVSALTVLTMAAASSAKS